MSYRNGVELSPVAMDNGFRHESFQTAYLPGNVQLRQGDNLIVECTFNTETRDEITFVSGLTMVDFTHPSCRICSTNKEKCIERYSRNKLELLGIEYWCGDSI